MTDYPDDDDWDDYPEYAETNDCDHEEYEVDILTGRATCDRCGHRWDMTDEQMKRHQELMAAPYPTPEA